MNKGKEHFIPGDVTHFRIRQIESGVERASQVDHRWALAGLRGALHVVEADANSDPLIGGRRFDVAQDVVRKAAIHLSQGHQGDDDVAFSGGLQVEEGSHLVVDAVVGEPAGLVVLCQLQMDL